MSWQSILRSIDRNPDKKAQERLIGCVAIPRRAKMKWRIIRALRARGPGRFGSFCFPIIRRMPERALVEQIVALQPMALPTAQVFYLDIVTGPPAQVPYQRRKHVPPEEMAFPLDEGVNVNESPHDEHQDPAPVGPARARWAATQKALWGVKMEDPVVATVIRAD